jgi:hypothetical protein
MQEQELWRVQIRKVDEDGFEEGTEGVWRSESKG